MKAQVLTPHAPLVRPVTGAGNLSMLMLLTAATVLLPPLCHMAGLPVRWLLPMHWPVVLAALVYGWRGGAVVGVLAPVLAWWISGYPLPPKLFPMTVELTIYGAVIGLLRERFRWHGMAATAAGLATGRLVFLAALLATGGNELPLAPYLWAAMAPGLVAAVAQTVVLPPLAARWVNRNR